MKAQRSESMEAQENLGFSLILLFHWSLSHDWFKPRRYSTHRDTQRFWLELKHESLGALINRFAEPTTTEEHFQGKLVHRCINSKNKQKQLVEHWNYFCWFLTSSKRFIGMTPPLGSFLIIILAVLNAFNPPWEMSFTQQPSPSDLFIKKQKFQLHYVTHLFCLTHCHDASGRSYPPGHKVKAHGVRIERLRNVENFFIIFHPQPFAFCCWINFVISRRK